MNRLEDLTPSASIQGILPNGLVTVVSVQWHGSAAIARELAYRLFTLAERKKRAAKALSYNGLVQSWPEIMSLAREGAAEAPQPEQAALGL